MRHQTAQRRALAIRIARLALAVALLAPGALAEARPDKQPRAGRGRAAAADDPGPLPGKRTIRLDRTISTGRIFPLSVGDPSNTTI